MLAAGCAGPKGPTFREGGGPIPLEVRNGTDEPVQVDVDLREAYGRSSLLHERVDLAPRSTASVRSPDVPYGAYSLEARAGTRAREIGLEFRGDTSYYRILVEADGLAYQTG